MSKRVQQLVRGISRMLPDLIPAGALKPVHELLDAVESIQASDLGVVPAWLQPLFEIEGQQHQVPPALLAALASVLSGFNPASRTEDHVGLAGVPRQLAVHPEWQLVASTAALAARDAAAVDALRRNVGEAARILAQLADADDGGRRRRDWPGAVVAYVTAGDSSTTAVIAAENVLGRFALYGLRRLPPAAISSARASLPR